jgi:Protein kinase domain/WD domain, G-beta repeat
MSHVLALPTGTELVGDFRIERVLGAGGFGITYLATETALARQVTIKEYFPSDFAARNEELGAVPRSSDSAGDYQWGLDRFLDEAQTLALFDHRNICRVYRYFRANNTGYMVLHFEEGASLKGWIKGLGRAPRQGELDVIVAPLLEALEIVHAADFLHRDIAPDNIMVRTDGSPVLIDFGSARGDIAQHSRKVSALVKPGYSPYEQYAETGKQQGPWTDIYALGATLYHCITGKRPPDSPSRIIKDEYVPAKDAAIASYRPKFLAAIDRSLALDIDKRPPTVQAWRVELLANAGEKPVKSGWLKKAKAEPVVAAAAADPAVARAKPVAADPAPAAKPQPARRGGLMEYLDALKRKPDAAADGAVPGPAQATVALNPPPPPPSVKVVPPEPVAAAKGSGGGSGGKSPAAAQKAEPKPPPPARRKAAPRPQAIRTGETSWRPTLVKVLLVAGVASAAYGLKDRLPRYELRGGVIVASSNAPKENQPLFEIRGHAGGTKSVAFTDDSRSLVSVGADRALKIWNAGSGSLAKSIDLGGATATSVAVSGRRAVTGHSDGNVMLWDLDTGAKVATLRRNEAAVWSVSFAGSNGQVLAASHDWSVTLWDAKTPLIPVHIYEGHENAAQAVAFTAAEGPFFASGSADKTVKLWNPESSALIRTYKGHKDFVTALGFSNDGRTLASGSLDGGVRLWSTSANRLVRQLSVHKVKVTGLSFSPTAEHLASGDEDGLVRIWDYKRGRSARTLSVTGPAVSALTYSSDGRKLAVASADGTIKVWDAAVAKVASKD